jgi:hypothetical protein
MQLLVIDQRKALAQKFYTSNPCVLCVLAVENLPQRRKERSGHKECNNATGTFLLIEILSARKNGRQNHPFSSYEKHSLGLTKHYCHGKPKFVDVSTSKKHTKLGLLWH